MTDNEIIKALECCSTDGGCEDCPAHGTGCELEKPALDLINRQKAEIEMLLPFGCQVEVSKKIEKEIKAEAIKEFAKRLKSVLIMYTYQNFDGVIDNLVKEMVGEE